MIMIYIFCFIIGGNSVNLHINEVIPVDFHIDKPVPEGLTKITTIACHDVYEAYSTKDEGHKIGNIMCEGKFIYEDSDILTFRRVLIKSRTGGSKIVLIYSIYNKAGKEYREVIEFKKGPSSENYAELVRIPVELDIKNEIRGMKEQIQQIICPKRIYFRISRNQRDRWIIGVVRYGNEIIDDSLQTITYKEAVKYEEEGKKIILIWKRTKDGYNIRTKYQIVEENGNVTVNTLEENINKIF